MALVAWALFLGAEAGIRLLDLYRRAPWIDVPSHVLSGVALGVTFAWAAARWRLSAPRGRATGGVLLAAALWEVVELVDEAISPDPPHLHDTFVWDGVGDVVVTTLAGALTVVALTRRRARPEPPPGGTESEGGVSA